MPKILVADDNTNIQRMVALALQERGIDVISVGNGEAAVRRLPDLNPDLILADIFMPVRNGYEVCEYVKKDSRFAEIPVILLIGAFDPLDEKEARRVGADGILKKPFVPPDPLIAMVMSILEKNPRVVAEMAKAKQAALAPPEPHPMAVEFASNPIPSPKPLPHFPEPSPEEAALAYGIGSGRRGVDAAKPGKASEPVPPHREAEEEDDNTSTSRDWRRSAMDFEIPEADSKQPAFATDELADPGSLPSGEIAPKGPSVPAVSDDFESMEVPVSRQDFSVESTQTFSIPSGIAQADADSKFTAVEVTGQDFGTQAESTEPAVEMPAEVVAEPISGAHSASEFAPASQAQSTAELNPLGQSSEALHSPRGFVSDKANESPSQPERRPDPTRLDRVEEIPAQAHPPVYSPLPAEIHAQQILAGQSRTDETHLTNANAQGTPSPAAPSEHAHAEPSFVSRVRGWMESIAPSGNPEGGWLASVAHVLHGGDKAKQPEPPLSDSGISSGIAVENASPRQHEALESAAGGPQAAPVAISSFETVLDEPFFLDEPFDGEERKVAEASRLAEPLEIDEPSKSESAFSQPVESVRSGDSLKIAEAFDKAAGFESRDTAGEVSESTNGAASSVVISEADSRREESIRANSQGNDEAPVSSLNIPAGHAARYAPPVAAASYREPDLVEPPAVAVVPEPLLIDEGAASGGRSEYGARPQEVPPLHSFIVPEAPAEAASELEVQTTPALAPESFELSAIELNAPAPAGGPIGAEASSEPVLEPSAANAVPQERNHEISVQNLQEDSSQSVPGNAFESAAEKPERQPREWPVESDVMPNLIAESPLAKESLAEKLNDFFAPETASPKSSSEAESEWTPTVAPPNREALADIPFLTPPREFLAEVNSQKTWGDPIATRAEFSSPDHAVDRIDSQSLVQVPSQPASSTDAEDHSGYSAAEQQNQSGTGSNGESQPHSPSNASVKAVAKEMMVDEVVRKVLDRLEPRLHELLSEGLLKPLVESILHEDSAPK